uniref:Uncharacterized protein n=1 Tax=Lactuca sativa TaxID=4236 RepID=A0A9R1WQ04_LACSA|nr:hypothetical protein LSAT_V11C100033490 [Lactuca sativa]
MMALHVSRSYGLIELGRRLRIYTIEETLSPRFFAYLDNCITAPSQEYIMQICAHTWGTYVSRIGKESAFHSPIYRSIHRLVASIIYHRQKCDKVPSGDLFYMWCLTQRSMALGSTPLSRICGGHWVTRLFLSYEWDGPLPIRELGTTAHVKIRVLVRGVGQQWMIPEDEIVEPIQ